MTSMGMSLGLYFFHSKVSFWSDAVWNSIVVNEAFQNPTHGNAGRSSAGRANYCPFHDNVLRMEPYLELRFSLCCWQVGHSCCVATWLLETSSSIAVLWMAFTWAQILHSCSVSIWGVYLHNFPQTSLLPKFQSCLFQVLDHWPSHHAQPRNRCSCKPLATLHQTKWIAMGLAQCCPLGGLPFHTIL